MMDALDHNVGNDMIEILKLVIENCKCSPFLIIFDILTGQTNR